MSSPSERTKRVYCRRPADAVQHEVGRRVVALRRSPARQIAPSVMPVATCCFVSGEVGHDVVCAVIDGALQRFGAGIHAREDQRGRRELHRAAQQKALVAAMRVPPTARRIQHRHAQPAAVTVFQSTQAAHETRMALAANSGDTPAIDNAAPAPSCCRKRRRFDMTASDATGP